MSHHEKLKRMIDESKITKAANQYNEGIETELAKKHLLKRTSAERFAESIARQCAFETGAKWAINELLIGFVHPASEVPRNDNGKVLAYSKEHGYRKLYDMNDELDKTTCDTYQEMWNEEVKAYHLTDWIFVDELFDLITKGGKHD